MCQNEAAWRVAMQWGMEINIPQCVTVSVVASSMQITHWKAESLTRLSSTGFLRSSGTSFVSVKSIVGRSSEEGSSPGVPWGGGVANIKSSISFDVRRGLGVLTSVRFAWVWGEAFTEVLRRLFTCTSCWIGLVAVPRDERRV